MELNDRKKRILNAIIQSYQETGEPVGSRTLSKLEGLELSPATIRNEMADLEDMGFIIQPHTSAGRIPTDKAYRLYVDELMQAQAVSGTELSTGSESLVWKRMNRMEELLMQMAKILAQSTQYATLVTGPKVSENKIKFIQLSPIEDGKVLMVAVLSGDIVKNHIINTITEVTTDELLQLNILINQKLGGLTAQEINLGVIRELRTQAAEKSELIDKVIEAIGELIEASSTPKFYTSGAPNIFKYPELRGEKAEELITTLEDKNFLIPVLGGTGEDKKDIQVFIGDEVPVESMKDCSVVTATYELGGGVHGKIGIIGPKRMDYEKVVNTIKNTMSELDDIFKDQEK